MKKIFVLLLAFAMIFSVSCGDKEAEITPAFEGLTVDYELNDDQDLTLCYADEEQMILAVSGKLDKDKPKAPATTSVTEKLIVYSFENNEITDEYAINEPCEVIDAVLSEDGIIYTAKEPENYADSVIRLVPMCSVRYTDGENDVVLDSDNESAGYYLSDLVKVKDEIYYMYTRHVSHGEEMVTSYGIRKAGIDGSETVYEGEEGQELYMLDLVSNGEKFAFAAVKDDNKAVIMTGDGSGVTETYEPEDYLKGFTITDEYITCITSSSRTEEKDMTVVSAGIDEETEFKKSIDKPLYGPQGAGSDVICTAMNSEIYLYRPGEEMEVISAEFPDELKVKKKSALVRVAGEREAVVQIDRNEFGILTW